MHYARSQCAVCQQVFAGTPAFDTHRVGPIPSTRKQRRRCLSHHEMRQLGMTQNEQGWWMLLSREHPAAKLPLE